MTLTIKLDRNWNSFQLANSAPPLSVTGSAIAPSARMQHELRLATFLTIYFSVVTVISASSASLAPEDAAAGSKFTIGVSGGLLKGGAAFVLTLGLLIVA